MNEYTSIPEIITIMKKAREKTDNFITDLKQSLYIEKNGEQVHPKSVHIRYFDNSYYTLSIDGYSFKLDKEGNVCYLLQNLKSEEKEKGYSILERNHDVISAALKHLESNSPQYYVTFTNTLGYMTFKDSDDDVQIDGTIDKITFSSEQLGHGLSINYYINNDSITISTRNNEIPVTKLAEVLPEIDENQIYSFFERCLTNAHVKTEKLPLILKTQISFENTKKTL